MKKLGNEKENTNNDKNFQKSKTPKILLIFFLIISFLCVLYIIWYYTNKNINTGGDKILNNINIEEANITENKTERMLQLEELQKENSEIIGWIEIEDTNINYPVLQTDNNDYYLTHTYQKKYSKTGSLFLDKDCDLINGCTNYLIYGHRSNDGTMFEDLMKYTDLNFYNSHKKIKFTTIKDESIYEILAVFYSRVYYKNETNVFRYYYFINVQNEQEFNEFVDNAQKASIYNTGVTAKYGDQLMTLSTCEYSQEDGRFAIVLKKML